MPTSQNPNVTILRLQTREPPKESLISRLLITPLTFVSFILSLALVSNHNTASRSHRTPTQTQTSNLRSHITQSMKYVFLFRANDQSSNPYADIRKPVPLGEEDGRPRLERGASSNSGRKEEGWYWHNNQKKLLKMEIGEALEMRKWVLVVLLGVLGLSLGVGIWALRKLWRMSVGHG